MKSTTWSPSCCWLVWPWPALVASPSVPRLRPSVLTLRCPFSPGRSCASCRGLSVPLVALFFYFSFLLVVLIDHPVLPQTVSAVRAKVMRAVSCPSQSMSPWLAPDELWAGPGPCACSLCLPSARPWPHSLAPVPFLATRAEPEPGNQAGLVFRLPVPAHYCAYSSLSRLPVISLSLLDCSHPLPLLAHW